MLCDLGAVHMMPVMLVVLTLMVGATATDRASQLKVVENRNPVGRVIDLLRAMETQIERESKADALSYDKQACWCETNAKEKASAIDAAIAKEARLTHEIDFKEKHDTKLKTEISSAKEAQTTTEEALATAENLRKQELEQNMDMQKALVKDIVSMNAAVTIVSQRNFAVISPTTMLSLKTVLRNVAVNYELMSGDSNHRGSASRRSSLSQLDQSRQSEARSASRELLSALDVIGPGMSASLPVQYAESLLKTAASEAGRASSSASFLQANKEKKYSPKTTKVFEALQKMLTDMQAKLVEMRATEASSKAAFDELRKAKKAELEAVDKTLRTKKDEETVNLKALSDCRDDLEQTTATKEADTQYLAALRAECQALGAAYDKRSGTRSEEIQVVTQVLAILTEDDTREHLYSSVSLLQTWATTSASTAEMTQEADIRRRAAKALRSIPDVDSDDDLLSAWRGRHSRSSKSTAPHSRSNALAIMAMNAQLKPMPEVKTAIQSMISRLRTEQATETTQKYKCINETQLNIADIQDAKADVEDAESSLESKNMDVDKTASDMMTILKQKQDLQAEFKKAEDNREQQKDENTQVVVDQRKTLGVLKGAITKLKAFYESSSFAQVVPQSGEYSKSGSATAVIKMLEHIVAESEKLVEETEKGEADAQAKFNELSTYTTNLVGQLDTQYTAKMKEKSERRLDAIDAQSSLDGKKRTVTSLNEKKDALKEECDWFVKNFQTRQDARTHEIEGLNAAYAILSGAK